MSSSDHDCAQRDQAAAYVLGALEQEQCERYQAHLHDCPLCNADVVNLQPIVDLLASEVPQVAVPQGLHERIMATVRSEAELLHAAGAEADRPARAARPRLRLRRLQLVAVTAAVGLGVLIGAVALDKSSQTPTTRLTPAQVASVPPGAKAFIRQVGTHTELVVSGIPQPPRGKIYEVWLAREGKAPQPTNALFGVTHAGSASVDVPGNLAGVKQVMVTAERRGGSEHPTSSPIIVATLRSS